MKFAFSWLKELSGTSLSPSEAAERFTLLGLEVEEMRAAIPDLSPAIVVGEVVSAEPVEGSTHLKQCAVSIGDANLQIVCGAPNVAAGQRVPVATVGSVLPGGMKIRKAKLRGVESHGMICSEAELGLSEEADGIMVINGGADIGTPFRQVLGDPETVIELAVTTNRPDCLGMVGLAREIAVSEGRSWQPEIRRYSGGGGRDSYPIELEDAGGCPRYTARILRNVKVGKSPSWLSERLHHAGVRSINNIVDITNYVMLLTGQPLHAFDLDRLENDAMVVRRARKDETFTTLDEKSHKLNGSELLICDGQRPVALAGIMGGLNSEVVDETTNVLLEAAYFDPQVVRKTSKRLGIFSESARRFERGVDPNGAADASNAGVQLLVELAGAEVTSELIDEYPSVISPPVVAFRPAQVRRILGTEVAEKRMRQIFEGLGCSVATGETAWQVETPTYRPDLTREIDLVEEVARVVGYDQVRPNMTDVVPLQLPRNSEVQFAERLRNICLRAGFSEALGISMISSSQAAPFVETDDSILNLRNPLSEEMSTMRPSLLSTLLPAVAYNRNRRVSDIRLFEQGRVFHANRQGGVEEHDSVAAVLTGERHQRTWQEKPKAADFFDAKGALEFILAELGITTVEFAAAKRQGFQFGAAVKLAGGQPAGFVGKIDPDVTRTFDCDAEVFAFEMRADVLGKHAVRQRHLQPLSPYPPVTRDLAIVVSRTVPAAALESTIRKAAGTLLSSVGIFDHYQGEQVAANQKSIAFSLEFQSLERTIRAEEVDGQISAILKKLNEEHGAVLR